MTDYSLLPSEKTFRQLFIPFFAPYFFYVIVESLASDWLSPEVTQGMKLVLVAAAVSYFFKYYAFGRLSGKVVGISFGAALAAILLWVIPLYFLKGQGAQFSNSVNNVSFSETYFWLRLLNSVLLAAIFEELFLRVYLMQWFYQAGLQRNPKGTITAVLDAFDQSPQSLAVVPLSLFSFVATTLFFTMGHRTKEWISAILYFSFTNYVYRKTGSLWVCILIHGITNLCIALLVRFGGMPFLWQ